MTAQHEHSTEWTPCPKGALTNLAGGLRRKRLQRKLTRLGSGAAVLLVAVTVGMLSVPQLNELAFGPGEQNCGGVTCTEIHNAATDFIAGHLQPALAEKIEFHLTQCGRCRDYIAEQRLQQANTEWDEIHPIAHTQHRPSGYWDWTTTTLLSVLPR